MLNRIYHPYHILEDYKSGMYRIVSKKDEERFLKLAIDFTGNHKKYGEYMLKVIDLWKITCEHNLTDLTQNRKAWIGHAACQLAIDCPEYITRSAWGYLSRQQQVDANNVADYAIQCWEAREGIERSNNAQMLFEY